MCVWGLLAHVACGWPVLRKLRAKTRTRPCPCLASGSLAALKAHRSWQFGPQQEASRDGRSRPALWWRTRRDVPLGPTRHVPTSIAEVVAVGWNSRNFRDAQESGALLVACLLWTAGAFTVECATNATSILRTAPGFFMYFYQQELHQHDSWEQDPTVFYLPRVCRWTWRSFGRIGCFSCMELRQPRQFRGTHSWQGLSTLVFPFCDYCTDVGSDGEDDVVALPVGGVGDPNDDPWHRLHSWICELQRSLGLIMTRLRALPQVLWKTETL